MWYLAIALVLLGVYLVSQATDETTRALRKLAERGVTHPVGPPWRQCITSSYGPRPNPTEANQTENHNGTDYRADSRVSILCTADGWLEYAAWTSDTRDGSWRWGYGIAVCINHGEFTTLYAHLDRISLGEARIGSQVKRGDLIGYGGSTGRVTGPHLHFGLGYNPRRVVPNDPFAGRYGDYWIDPERLVGPTPPCSP